MPITQTFPATFGANTAPLGANWQLQFIQPDGLPLTMAGLEIIDFGAISYKEIFQNVKTILATALYSAPLERTLGLDQTIVDTPINSTGPLTIAILAAVNQWEPRCSVMNINFEADAINGHLVLLLQLDIKNVIYQTNTPYAVNSITPQPQQQQLPPDMSTTPIPGPPGPPGPQGPRGSLWYVGSTDPGPGLGTPQNPVQAQDMYLNTTTGDVFQFTSASSTVASRWAKIKQGNKYNVVDERR